MPAWSSMWSSIGRGEFGDAFSYAFLDQETVDASNTADSQLESMVRQASADDKISIDDLNLTLKRIQQNALPELLDNPEMSPGIAFQQGFIEQAKKEMSLVDKGIKGVADFTFGLIPWQVYVIAGVLIVIYVLSIMPRPAAR